MAGRPEFKPTPDMRKEVMRLIAGRMTEKEIAIQFGVDEKTLRKHFRKELDEGFIRANADLLLVGYEKAIEGNATFWKAWFARIDKQTTAQPGSQATSLDTPALGKKEQKAIAATKAGVGSEWGDILRPPGAPRSDVH